MLDAVPWTAVIVVGEAGSGKSHLIDARVDWRAQANQFYPSSVDSPHLQLYLGSGVVVHELSAPLLHDITSATRRALARLWRHAGPSATVVVVVNARALSATPPDAIRELAQLVRGKIGALPRRVRDKVPVRVCLSNMDQIDGYDELVSVLGADHAALDIGPLTERYADADALLAAARSVMAKHDPNLAYGLTHRTGEEFSRLVGFYATFPVLLTQLAPLVRGLAGEDPDQARYAPSGLHLSSLTPENHVGDPFVVDRKLVSDSIARQRRFHRRTSLALAAAGSLAALALMWWHGGRVEAAEEVVASYSALAPSARGANDAQARRVVTVIDRMDRSERLWLARAYVERKRVLEARFAKDLREQYLLPKLRVPKVNRSTMLYLVALLYASEANGLRALIRGELPLWSSKLGLSQAVVAAYLEVSRDQYEVAEPFDPVYTGSDWQGYIFDQVKPLYDKTALLTQAELSGLDVDPPQLYDEREYTVRKQIVELISAQLSLATYPPITKLLESALGRSEWVEANRAALLGISTTVQHGQLAPTTPSSLAELGSDLERMLSVPASGKEMYSVSRDKEGGTEELKLDVATWRRKIAQASASKTIEWVDVRNRSDAKTAPAIGFFAPGTTLRDVGAGTGSQGAKTGLPGMYTAAAFAQYVKPALDFATTRAGKLGLSDDDLAKLKRIYLGETESYAGGYARALRAYYDSFQFNAGSEQALPYALATLAQPSSWFVRFLTTMAVNATPALGDGPYYEVIDESLASFRPLAELLAPAKGTIPGLAPYQKIVTELAAQLEAGDDGGTGSSGGGGGGGAGGGSGAASADGGTGALPTLASTLSATGTLTLNKLTGADKDQVAQVSGWLTGANVDTSFHEPFLAPVRSVYAFGTADIDRAIGKAWTGELSPVIAPLFARFPFRVRAKTDAAIADLDVLRAQGKQPGAFWAAFQRWLGAVTVQRNGKYQWLTGLSGPAGALTTINDVARLSRALWDGDGNPTALPIKITPQPLDGSAVDERVPIMAYLRSGSSAVYAFNQRPVSSTLALQWWDQGASSLIIDMRKPGATETATYSVDESEAPFSFYRLLCRSRSPTSTSPQTTTSTCEAKSGARVWDIPLDGSQTRSVTLTLEADPWALFQIGR